MPVYPCVVSSGAATTNDEHSNVTGIMFEVIDRCKMFCVHSPSEGERCYEFALHGCNETARLSGPI